MSQAIQSMKPTAVQLSGEIVSNIVLKGDIAGLTPTEKVQYYRSVCERVGLDPATQPFQLLKLSGKEVLYCSKAGAEQLTKIHKVSHEIKDRQTINDVHIVYVRAIEQGGRFEDSSGAVTIAGLKGDGLANALMKAETKAKRRSTLSLLGLGMLDETEVETIPGAEPIQITPSNEKVATVDIPPEPQEPEPTPTQMNLMNLLLSDIQDCGKVKELMTVHTTAQADLKKGSLTTGQFLKIKDALTARKAALQ